MTLSAEAEVLAYLSEAEPAQIRDFLLAKGWVELESPDEGRSYWTLEAEGNVGSVLLPLRRTFRDYSLRIRELAHELRRMHALDWDELLLELLSRRFDVVRLQSKQQVPADGSITFQEGFDLLTGTRDMMRAAAKATTQKRPYFGQRNSGAAERYIQSLRLGQSERGSYVFNVLAALEEAEPTGESETTQEPMYLPDGFSRLVTRTLVDALDATKEAISQFQEERDFRPFMEAVVRGVSADLCDSLLHLISIERQESIELSVTWSASRPRPGRPIFVFDRSDLPPLETARNRLSATESLRAAVVQGVIQQMRREEIKEGSPFVVTLRVVDGPPGLRFLRIRLGWEAFHEAIAAFDTGSLVRVVGDIQREGNFFWLYEPRRFEVGGRPVVEAEGRNLRFFETDEEPE